MTLTEFLLARVSEDNTRATLSLMGNNWQAGERAMAECESKWRIIRVHQASQPQPAEFDDCPNVECKRDAEVYPCETLRSLGTIYADHADYSERWRP